MSENAPSPAPPRFTIETRSIVPTASEWDETAIVLGGEPLARELFLTLAPGILARPGEIRLLADGKVVAEIRP